MLLAMDWGTWGKMVKTQERKFEKMQKAFMEKVVSPYDSQLKGGYFIYQRDANGNGGILMQRSRREKFRIQKLVYQVLSAIKE